VKVKPRKTCFVSQQRRGEKICEEQGGSAAHDAAEHGTQAKCHPRIGLQTQLKFSILSGPYSTPIVPLGGVPEVMASAGGPVMLMVYLALTCTAGDSASTTVTIMV
jgi:hypothetical protein